MYIDIGTTGVPKGCHYSHRLGSMKLDGFATLYMARG